jgi:hypothetical protein
VDYVEAKIVCDHDGESYINKACIMVKFNVDAACIGVLIMMTLNG